MCPSENIHIEFNFIIQLPKTYEPRSYKVAIDIHSRAAIIHRARTLPGDMSFLRRYTMTRTGRFDIEYVDYAVAKNLYTVIDQWFESLQTDKNSSVIVFLQKNSHDFGFIFRIFGPLIAATPFIYKIYNWNEQVLLLNKNCSMGLCGISYSIHCLKYWMVVWEKG